MKKLLSTNQREETSPKRPLHGPDFGAPGMSASRGDTHTGFKNVGDGTTKSYQTIRASIYRPSGCQGIAGFVSTRRATILSPSSALECAVFPP